MRISASELNKRPGNYLAQAGKEPVVVEKAGQPAVVMVSYDYFLKLEDSFWGEKAIEADQDVSIGHEDAMNFLLGDD